MAKSPDNQLSIVESTPNSIILSNVGIQPIKGRIKIIRKHGYFYYVVQFTLATFFYPGMAIKLVPEGKGEDGSKGTVQLRGYRSFGPDRGRKVETKVFIDGKLAVIRKDTYVKLPKAPKEDEKPKKNDVVPIEA